MKLNISAAQIQSWIKKLVNPEVIAGVVIMITVIAVSFNTSRVILQNYRLSKQVQEAERRLSIAQIELENQRLQNNYYRTDAFLEIAARRQLSKGFDGEKLVIVPKSVALANVPSANTNDTNQDASATPPSRENLSNFERWLKFLNGDLEYLAED
jgi:hypothetical protein